MTISRLPFCLGLAVVLSATASAATAQQMNADPIGDGTRSPGMMGGDMMGGDMMGGGMMGGGMMSGGMMPCPMMDGGKSVMQKLEPEQRSELRELIHEHRPAQLQRLGQLMNLRDDMAVALQAERPELETIQTLHARMAELQGEMLTESVRLHNSTQDLMTAEQRERLQQATPEAADPDDHEAHH
ncbi:periplasmic heavy metal sensor [Billgrantia lactosivorans]|uniref:periplasmic heavy metal sensor n=1 Tax=Billgrantia lactosivorans TaxID=2185141 RepID=UPI000DADEAAA|nr:periplasmic heavy metal sensor [Halomonas lactosivorans]